VVVAEGTLDLAAYYEALAKTLLDATVPSSLVESSLRRAVEIRSRLQGEEHPQVLQSRRNLGVAVCEVRHLSKLAAAGVAVVTTPVSAAPASRDVVRGVASPSSPSGRGGQRVGHGGASSSPLSPAAAVAAAASTSSMASQSRSMDAIDHLLDNSSRESNLS
jgi:hypothetical protein